MSAGQLRNRVTIQEPSTGQDSIGQPLTGWSDVALVWADIRHQSGLSAIKSGMDVSVVRVSVRIRHRAGLNAGMRVLYGTEVFSVNAVLPDERRAYLDLVCEATNVVS